MKQHTAVTALFLVVLLWLTACANQQTSQITVSAASNLIPAFEEIKAAFEAQTGINVVYNFGGSGKLAQQIERGADVFQLPNSKPVAEITGIKNIWEGIVTQSAVGGLRVQWGETIIKMPPANYSVGQRVVFYIQPEDVKIIRTGKPITDILKHNLLEVTVTNIIDRGTAFSVTVVGNLTPEAIQLRFRKRSYPDLDLRIGKNITVSLLRDAITLLPTRDYSF